MRLQLHLWTAGRNLSVSKKTRLQEGQCKLKCKKENRHLRHKQGTIITIIKECSLLLHHAAL